MTRVEWERVRTAVYNELTRARALDPLEALDRALPESLVGVAPPPRVAEPRKKGRPRKKCKHPASARKTITKRQYGHEYETSICIECRNENQRRYAARRRAAA